MLRLSEFLMYALGEVKNYVVSVARKAAVVGIGLGLLVAFLLVRQRGNNRLAEKQIENSRQVSIPAQSATPDEKRTAESEGGLEPYVDPKEEPAYIPPESTVVITPKDPTKKLGDVVNVKIENSYGWTEEPGLSLSIYPVGIGLDMKYFYVGKVGFEFGLQGYFKQSANYSPTVGVSYRLDRFKMLKNTELQLNYAPTSNYQFSTGLRLGF